ncbi:hypothetical protein ACFW04_007620 [Cataglyphis niger]
MPKEARTRGTQEEAASNLMTPHPGVARTLYLAKKDLITRSHSWTRILRSSVFEWENPPIH